MHQKKDYRNVFTEVGFSEAEVARRLEEIRQTWFYGKDNERVYFPVGDDMAFIMEFSGRLGTRRPDGHGHGPGPGAGGYPLRPVL